MASLQTVYCTAESFGLVVGKTKGTPIDTYGRFSKGSLPSDVINFFATLAQGLCSSTYCTYQPDTPQPCALPSTSALTGT